MAPTPGPNQTTITELNHPEQANKVPDVKEIPQISKANEVDIFNGSYPPAVIKWPNVAFLTSLHIGGIAGLYAVLTGQVMWQTMLWGFAFYILGGLGITAGVHRLWSHKAYKAKLPLRAFLAVLNTIAFQNSIFVWARDHRVHHKYSETLADPHNAKRGFFFAHVGWLMSKKHPAVKQMGEKIDISDLEADPIVMFQHRHYVPLVALFTFILPAVGPWYFWGETAYNSMTMSVLKYLVTLHATWLVNSGAHYWGNRPYDRAMYPRQNKFVSVIALGEGWHNYHHTFPWDYKTAELGAYRYNYTKAFLDLMAVLGQAFDMKTVPEHIVKQRITRTGDGSHSFSHDIHDLSDFKPGPYAWGDEDIPEADLAVTETLYPKKEKLN